MCSWLLNIHLPYPESFLRIIFLRLIEQRKRTKALHTVHLKQQTTFIYTVTVSICSSQGISVNYIASAGVGGLHFASAVAWQSFILHTCQFSIHSHLWVQLVSVELYWSVLPSKLCYSRTSESAMSSSQLLYMTEYTILWYVKQPLA